MCFVQTLTSKFSPLRFTCSSSLKPICSSRYCGQSSMRWSFSIGCNNEGRAAVVHCNNADHCVSDSKPKLSNHVRKLPWTITKDTGTKPNPSYLPNILHPRQFLWQRSLTPASLSFSTSSCLADESSSSTASATDSSSTSSSSKKENIATIPNMLTASRMAVSPLIGYLVVSEAYAPAMILFACAGFTDLLDGYIARKFPGQASTLGMAIDPLADKLLMTIMTLSLTCADLFPTTLTVLIITRDLLLIASGFALRYFSLAPPITLKRYFDISLPSAEVYPTSSSKLNTAVQLLAVAASLAAPLASLTGSPALQALWLLAGATTVWSGASYAYNGASCFKILSEENQNGSGSGRKVSMKEIQMIGGVGFSLGLAFVCWKSI